MAYTNFSAKEINCKIIYFGPTGSGKSTNLKSIYALTSVEQKSKIVSLSEEYNHTAFFDFLPLSAGYFQNFHIKLHIYTLPSSRFFNNTKSLILKGIDGIVFVVDSRFGALRDNIDTLQQIQSRLKKNGYNTDTLPTVIQYNKRDAEDAVAVEELKKSLNPLQSPEVNASATQHIGTLETFEKISTLVLDEIKIGAEH